MSHTKCKKLFSLSCFIIYFLHACCILFVSCQVNNSFVFEDDYQVILDAKFAILV